MPSSFIELSYLVSAICFMIALKGLSSPRTARIGSLLAIAGMTISLLATFLHPQFHQLAVILITIAAGGSIGTIIAKRIAMTAMPQLVAGFHSLVGLASVLVALAALLSPENFSIGYLGNIKSTALWEMSIGAIIGAITFSGSLIAFGKLQGIISSRTITFPGQQYFCITTLLIIVLLTLYFTYAQYVPIFFVIILLSLLIGALLIIPVGGADMPVIVSMLNSYSGWAASGIGFTLQNNLLIITGALVGASGAILSYIMCKAMNRSLFTVIFGAFIPKDDSLIDNSSETRVPKISSPEDAAFQMKQSHSMVVVPGYGMAVAQSQHAIKEMVDILEQEGLEVRFAIHPVAGRMPGHMNVLLAEAGINYEKVLELDDINRDFTSTDIVLVIGANDVTNPAAKTDKTSPIYGMPVLDVGDARVVYFIKRSMAAGYAGIQNELFFNDNTLMLFGDAKKVIEDITKSLRH